MAVAGLQEHVISENTIRNDHGSWQIPGSKPNSKAFGDWKRWGSWTRGCDFKLLKNLLIPSLLSNRL
ncbi:hypothetical protein O9929_25565 [Vibrio lentus]|nr:hypothetical protein [Vibrio lentus]